jgi:hypothetical protein
MNGKANLTTKTKTHFFLWLASLYIFFKPLNLWWFKIQNSLTFSKFSPWVFFPHGVYLEVSINQSINQVYCPLYWP